MNGISTTSQRLPLGAGLIGSKKVQSTIIFVANFIRIRSGAEHRNPIIFRCAAPCELYFYRCYKYFAALPLAKIRTNQPCPWGLGENDNNKIRANPLNPCHPRSHHPSPITYHPFFLKSPNIKENTTTNTHPIRFSQRNAVKSIHQQ